MCVCIYICVCVYIYIYSVKINPLNAKLNPICPLLHYSELTIFSTLAGKGLRMHGAMPPPYTDLCCGSA